MKKALFYLPVALVFGVLVWLLYGFRGSILDNLDHIFLPQIGIVLMFLASAVLLDRGRWYGCIPEIALSLWFIYCGITNTTIPLINEALIGFVLAAYYVVCGFVSWRSSKKA